MLHNNEVISCEEDIDVAYHTKQNCNIRRFTLKNNLTGFQVTIKTTGASLISAKDFKTNKDELIRLDNDENQQTNSLNRNQLIQLAGFEWQSHVLGLDSISFATNIHHNSTITYQLTELNELFMIGKLRSVNHLSYLNPFFFNLNTSSSSIDGHFLHIKAIKLDKFQDKEASNLKFSLTGDAANTNNDFLSFFKSPGRISWSTTQDKKVYDLIYTLQGKYSEASILTILSYGTKRIEFTIQNSLNNYSTQIANNNFQNQITNSSSNQLNNTQNQCKLRIRISQAGISLLPSMHEFKSIYKFHL